MYAIVLTSPPPTTCGEEIPSVLLFQDGYTSFFFILQEIIQRFGIRIVFPR